MADDLNVKVGVTDSQAQTGLAAVVSTLKTSVDQMMASLAGLGTSSNTLAGKIQTNNTAIGNSFKAMSAQVGVAHGQITGFFGKINGAMTALTSIIAGGVIAHFIMDIGKASADYAEEIFRASEKTGIAIDKLQELKAVGELNEVSFRALQLGLQRISLQMVQAQQGSKKAVDEFKRLGIEVNELKGMSLDEVLFRMADKFNETANNANKMALSQQLLSRAGREFIPLLNQGSAGLKEQIKLVRDLGVVMDEQSLYKAKALKEEMKALHLVNEGLNRQISTALVPAFTAIASAMISSRKEGGAFRDMIGGLGDFLIGLTKIGSYVAEAFEGVGHALGGLAAIAVAVATGQFGRAGRIMQDFLSDTTVTDKWDKFRADLEKPIKIPPIVTKPDIGSGTGGKTAKDTRMAEWKEELEEKREAVGPFRELEKADEIAFWESKLTLIKGNTEKELALRRQVLQIIRNDKKAAAKEEQALDVEILEKQIAAQHLNLEAQIALSRTLTAFQLATWGERNKHYQDALARQLALEQKQTEQLEKIDKMRTELRLKADMQQIAIDEEMAKRAVDLRLMSNEQQLAAEAGFEARRYALQTATIAKERAAIQADQLLGDAEKEAKMLELDGRLEAIESQHQLKMTQIATAAEKERQQIAIDAANAVQNAFATALGNIAMNTKKLKDNLLDMVRSLTSELTRLAANDVAKKLFGAGTTGGNALTGIFGKIFGVSSAGGTGAATADAAMVTLSTTVTTVVDPAMAALSAAAQAASAALASVGASSAGGGAGGLLGGFDWEGMMGSFAVGTSYVPRDMLAYVHKGEAITPAKYNISGGGGQTIGVHNEFNFSGPVDRATQTQIYLASYRATQRAAMRH